MKTTLPCCAVRDLLPLYAEQLTSEETAAAVREHLDGCADCAKEYEKMTAIDEPQREEAAEVDYLKSIRRSRKRWILGAICAAVLICGGLTLFFALRAGRTTVRLDGNTLRVYGTGDYADLTLSPEEAGRASNLDAVDDSFYLSAYLPAFGSTDEPMQTFLPAFLERTDQSLAFIRSYLKDNAPDCYPADLAEQFVDLQIDTVESYRYASEDDRIVLKTGAYFWHRDNLYVLALLNADSVEWQQIGYAFYLGACVNPYGEMENSRRGSMENEPYYEAFCKLNGMTDTMRLNHAIAYVCLRDGMGWGSAYSSEPVTKFAYFTGPKKELGGTALSPAMATSLIGWLTERYGFDKVSAFCFGKTDFQEAFGMTFSEAYDAWSAWLLAACA